MPSEQEIQYHRSFLSWRYGDNFSDRIKAFGGSLAKPMRERWEIEEIREDDPEGFEEARKALAALLKVEYRRRGAVRYGNKDYVEIDAQPSDEQVVEYLKPQYPPQGVVKNPTNGWVAYPLPDVSIEAYRDGQPPLHTFMRVKGDQYFKTYATPWELDWSSIFGRHSNYPGQSAFTPIVDTSWTVIGYVGSVKGGTDCNLIVPVGIWDHYRHYFYDLDDILKREIPLFVGSGSHPPAGWESAHGEDYGHSILGNDTTDVTYTIKTTIDGEVVAVLGVSNREGKMSVWYTPWDLLSFGKAVVALGKIGAKMTRTLVRKATAKLEARAVFRGATKDLADEVKRRATKKPPAVAPPSRPTHPSELMSRAPIKSPRLLAKHPGCITLEALRDELKQKGFELAKEGKHSMQGLPQDSEIWVRKVPNPAGKGPEYFEAVRIDIRNPNPTFQVVTPVGKTTGKPMTASEVQAADRPFRRQHHTLNDPTVKESERAAADKMNQGMKKEDLTHWHHERFPATQENLTEYLKTPAQGSGGAKITGLEKLDPTGKVIPMHVVDRATGEIVVPHPGSRLDEFRKAKEAKK
jgi:hypothetical protein